MSEPLSPERPLRADAARNRASILAAARAAFAEKGAGVGVDEIADRAGVGMGTLYRRFPTKDSLVLAILEERVDAVAREASAVADLEAAAALERFMARTLELMAEDRGLLQVLSEHLGPAGGRDALRERYLAALEPLVARARAARVLREDLEAADLAALLKMLATTTTQPMAAAAPGWERYLPIVLAGVRPAG